jgi:hypothetical protein
MVIMRRKFCTNYIIHDIDIYYLEFVSAVRIYRADLNKWRRFFLNHRKCYTPRVRAKCSLSLWRAARGRKRMCLELIHGLFIT